MNIIRPEVTAGAWHWREVIAAAAFGAFGLWLVWLGGYVLFPAGLLVLVAAAAWALTALRRLRFAQGVHAPGVVEVDEGQIGYMGPTFGGYVALPDLSEIRLVTMYGRRMWRLKQADGQTVLIPIDAAGAERLFDAFASLPGMDMGAMVAALGPVMPGAVVPSGLPVAVPVAVPDAPVAADMRLIWRRQAALSRQN